MRANVPATYVDPCRDRDYEEHVCRRLGFDESDYTTYPDTVSLPCQKCGKRIARGELIYVEDDEAWICPDCASQFVECVVCGRIVDIETTDDTPLGVTCSSCINCRA